MHAAPSPVIAKQSPQVKNQTIKALQAIDQGRWDLGRDIIAKTKDPLASKLYYWLVFKRKNEDQRFVRLTQFIRNNPEWPSTRDLRLKAEDAIPEGLSAASVAAWFADYPPLTERGMDNYLKALMAQGNVAKAKAVLSDWWARVPLKRQSQKNIYLKYGKLLDIDAHRRRFDMLLFAGQYENARAVANVLKRGYPQLAEARIALAKEKKSVSALIAKVPASLQGDTGLLYERLRWRRRNDLDARAIEILENMPPAHMIENKKDWWRERHIIIRRMLEEKQYSSAYILASGHIQESGFAYAQAEWLSGWLSLRFLGNAPRALEHFGALYSKVSTPVSKARAAYWAGRAAEKIGSADLSKGWYEKAVRYQTVYYGQMAGGTLGVEQALPNAAPPVLTAMDIGAFEKNELMQAARLFHQAGMRKDASKFIHAFTADQKTPKSYRYAAEQAGQMKRYHDALRIAKAATKQGMFLTSQSFPVITEQLRGVPVEWALVHALIRQESLFDVKAKSPAGARGLMQLMPGTAKEVAKKIGLRYQLGWLTAQPAYNIRLGSQYLADMLTRFGGSYPLAIAAYNAGPNRVDRWIKTYGDPRLGQVSFTDWIELIPIYETRNYVQRVMENVYIYRLRLKGIQKTPQTPLHAVSHY